MQVECTNPNALVVNKLPDGSRVILDPSTETVYALNAAAGAAWEACNEPTTLAGVTMHMRRSFDANTSEELAEQAIFELEEKKLVRTSQTTRRQMLGRLGAAAALPLVVSLTLADQRAYALSAGSGKGSSPTPPKLPIVLPPPPPPPPLPPKKIPL